MLQLLNNFDYKKIIFMLLQLSSLLSGALPLPSAPHYSIPPNAGAASNNYGNNVVNFLLFPIATDTN